MARIALTRRIHCLPGKRQSYVEFLDRANGVRRRWGLEQAYMMEKAIDPAELLEIQIWESEERYQEWQKSDERTKLAAEGRHLRVREPTLMYRVLEEE